MTLAGVRSESLTIVLGREIIESTEVDAPTLRTWIARFGWAKITANGDITWGELYAFMYEEIIDINAPVNIASHGSYGIR